MNTTKRNRLITELSHQPAPQVISIDRFFDGNDDAESIGCTLLEHPGMETFEKILVGLTRHPDVEAVYARICELDPGAGCWPSADTVYIAGTISPDELRAILTELEPNKVILAGRDVPAAIAEKHKVPIFAALWD